MAQKKSPSFFGGWQDRMIEVHDKTFTYFKVKNGVEEKTGTLNFEFYECFINMEGSN